MNDFALFITLVLLTMFTRCPTDTLLDSAGICVPFKREPIDCARLGFMKETSLIDFGALMINGIQVGITAFGALFLHLLDILVPFEFIASLTPIDLTFIRMLTTTFPKNVVQCASPYTFHFVIVWSILGVAASYVYAGLR